MDNVSSVKFEYKIIRTPHKKTCNIFSYAAMLTIMNDNTPFLRIEDICIIDFINRLSMYDGVDYFEFIPIDSSDKVLIFEKINVDMIKISSKWTDNVIIVYYEQLIESISNLKSSFEKITKISTDSFRK